MVVEHARVLHTLDEDHNHLLAAAFEASLSGSTQGGAGLDPSSSAVGDFGLDDSVFAFPEGASGMDIGDELARELGEDWGIPMSATGQEYVLHVTQTLGLRLTLLTSSTVIKSACWG